MGVGSWVEVALGSRVGLGPMEAGTMEKGLRTECHLESPKVESGEEEDEIVPAHRGTVRTQGVGTWVRGLAITCWWVRCPSSLYPRASTRAPSREISVWMC